jgi:AraC-like DNA-binding protein
MHRETASRIRAAVGWVNEPEPTDRPGAVLPDGCMDLMWVDGELLVAGADTGPRPIPRTAGTKVGLRFAPGHLPMALGVPAHELADQQVRLADLHLDGSRARAMAAAEQELHDSGASVRVLEELALALGIGRAETGFVDAVSERARRGRSIADIADDLGLGTRQLHRRCLPAFGYGPKLLGRVLRLERALALGRDGRPAAIAAAEAGFADQAHLARDVRELAGTTFSTLVSER